MKNFKKVILLTILLVIYTYVVALQHIPSNIVVFEGEKLSLNTLFGITLNLENDDGTVQAVSNINNTTINEAGRQKVSVNLFDNIEVKKLSVDVIPKTTVIPVGNVAGLKLYTSGVLVVGMTEIQGIDNKKYKPFQNSGIEEGDRIISIDEASISTVEELTNKVNTSNGNKLDIEYVHGEETKKCSIVPVQTSSTEYKLGLWVRDSAAGVGTVTFYEPSSKMFAALGHGITDIDTGDLINIASGKFVTSRILNVVKGKSGEPGKIQGSIENGQEIGEIYKNSVFGVYGRVDNLSALNLNYSNELEVALREEIKTGEASIICSLDNQTAKEYKIEIEKIYLDNNYDNKSMKIKVTDEELIQKTGGIIQGMSGAPIIQNGKFVAAVTNVLVNSPTEGYAVFGDLMIKQMKAVQ